MSRIEIINTILVCLQLQIKEHNRFFPEDNIFFNLEDIDNIYNSYVDKVFKDESIGYYVRVYLECNYFELE